MTVAIILFLLFFVLFLGVPIAFGLGSIGLGLMLFGDISPLMIPQTFYSVADNFILLAVPMFLMMSNILFAVYDNTCDNVTSVYIQTRTGLLAKLLKE